MKRTNRVAWGLAAALAAVWLAALGSGACATTEPFATIAKRGIAAPKLDAAMAQLPLSPTEPPEFWSKIANDPTYSRYHRRRAVFQLLRRHFHPWMRVAELGRLLDRPTWLRSSDILPIGLLAGGVPLHFDPRDTFYVLRIWPEPNRDDQGVWLRITGDPDPDAIRGCLLGAAKDNPAIEQAMVAEFSLCDARNGGLRYKTHPW